MQIQVEQLLIPASIQLCQKLLLQVLQVKKPYLSFAKLFQRVDTLDDLFVRQQIA